MKSPCLVLGGSACLWACAMSPPAFEAYLQGAQAKATMQDVREKLGPPTFVSTRDPIGETWLYQVAASGPDLPGDSDIERLLQRSSRVPPPAGSDATCMRYRLVFDAESVLRAWSRIGC